MKNDKVQMSVGFIAECDEQILMMREEYEAKKLEEPEESKEANQISKSKLKKMKKQKSKYNKMDP